MLEREAPRPHRAGRMTTAMRAVSREAGTKVLRVGVVERGRVLEERLFLRPVAITVGPSEHDTFVVVARGIDARTRLFEPTPDGAILHVAPGMHAAIARGKTTRSVVGPASIELDRETRGKIVVGDVSLLFQFVAPPPSEAKPQLPASVTMRASDVDWWIATFAAFSFLAHFAAVGLFYSDWGDRIVPDEHDAVGLVEHLGMAPPPSQIETSVASTSSDQTGKPTSEPKAPRPKKREGTSDTGNIRSNGDRRADGASLVARLDAMDRAVVGVFSTSRSATDGVLRDGNVPTGPLGDLARSDAAARDGGPGGLHVATGGPVDPSARRTLGQIGETRAAEGTGDTVGVAQHVAAPKPSVSTSMRTSGGRLEGAEAALARVRGQVRQCYLRGLDANPDMEGRVSYAITVGAAGSATNVSATPSGSISPAVAACIQGALRGVSFAPPEGGSAVVTGSFGLVNANKGK